jgi:voltage-gated potassium channel
VIAHGIPPNLGVHGDDTGQFDAFVRSLVLPFFIPFMTADARFLRILRLMRLLRLAKISRYWRAFPVILRVFKNKKSELLCTIQIFFVFLTLNSGLIYTCERDVQPEAFSSIPAAMWWRVITMTTVGYGDLVLITIPGKLLATLTGVLGVGFFALFAGVLVSGFAQEMKKKTR